MENFYTNSKAVLNLGIGGNISTILAIKGNADMQFSLNGRANFVSTFKGKSEFYMLANGKINAIKQVRGSIYTALKSNGKLNIVIAYSGVAVVVLVVTSKGFNTYRYEYLKLTDLVMRVGDELVINTDEMTVTLNGQNAIQYLSMDSEFFLLNPHENDIIYTSNNANDKTDIKILWKDAYL